MRSKDLFLLGALTAAVCAPLIPALARPWFVFANTGDLYGYHYPLRHLAAGALQAGRLPFWNPYIFGGLPLAANPQSVLYYPLSLLSWALPLSAALSWDFAFHLCWAAWGAALLARRQGLRGVGAALAGGIYALSPFLVYRVYEGIPTLLAALAWAPWCWLFWLAADAPLLAVAWALQLFSGHPQFSAINAAGMLLWAALRPERKTLAGRWAVAGLMTVALAAVVWLPLGEFLRHSVRRGWPEPFTTAYSVELKTLACALYPGVFGDPLRGNYDGIASVFFETSGVFIGVVGLALAAFGLSRAGAGPFVLAAAGLFLAWGGNNPAYAFLLKGPLGWLRTPARYLFLLLWALWLWAAAGWRSISRAGAPGWLRLAAAAACLFELGRWDARFLRAEDSRPYLAARADVARAVGAKPFRVLTDPGLASADKTMLYRARNVNGYEAFYLEGFPEYARRSEGRAAVDASRAYLSRYDSPEMRRMAVRTFISASGALVESPGALPLAYFVDAAGRPAAGSVEIDLPRPERWRVSGAAPKDAVRLVAAQPLYPGWRSRLDGRPAPLEAWDGWLQSIPLAPRADGAPFHWTLDFEPTAWPAVAALSILAWSAWLGALGARARELWTA